MGTEFCRDAELFFFCFHSLAFLFNDARDWQELHPGITMIWIRWDKCEREEWEQGENERSSIDRQLPPVATPVFQVAGLGPLCGGRGGLAVGPRDEVPALWECTP